MNEVFKKVILKYLKNKTIILITNCEEFFWYADKIVKVEKGKIEF